MTNLIAIILCLSIIIWGLSILWSICKMVDSELNSYELSPLIISVLGVIPLLNTIIAIILSIYEVIQNNKLNIKKS